ncbi:MAG: hypothetical protein IT462_14465 [Planctomycetes bacterium]|nr:hypothetical protein [Planctomycetota bacterium]
MPRCEFVIAQILLVMLCSCAPSGPNSTAPGNSSVPVPPPAVPSADNRAIEKLARWVSDYATATEANGSKLWDDWGKVSDPLVLDGEVKNLRRIGGLTFAEEDENGQYGIVLDLDLALQAFLILKTKRTLESSLKSDVKPEVKAAMQDYLITVAVKLPKPIKVGLLDASDSEVAVVLPTMKSQASKLAIGQKIQVEITPARCELLLAFHSPGDGSSSLFTSTVWAKQTRIASSRVLFGSIFVIKYSRELAWTDGTGWKDISKSSGCHLVK